jgi:hypothetical protein
VPPDRRQQLLQNKLWYYIFTGTKLLVLDVLLREGKFNQNFFLAIVAPNLAKENQSAKDGIGKKSTGHPQRQFHVPCWTQYLRTQGG